MQSFMPAISGELVPNRHRYLALGITFLLMAPLSTISPGLGKLYSILEFSLYLLLCLIHSSSILRSNQTRLAMGLLLCSSYLWLSGTSANHLLLSAGVQTLA